MMKSWSNLLALRTGQRSKVYGINQNSLHTIAVRGMASNPVKKIKFPWELNDTIKAFVGSESLAKKMSRHFFFFTEADRLSEKSFFDRAIASYQASWDTILDYSQQVQQLIQQDPSSLRSLPTHASLEQGRKKVTAAVSSPLCEDLLKNIHRFYAANPSAEVVYQRDEAAGPPVQIETYPSLSVTILPVSSPTASVFNSSKLNIKITFPSTEEEAKDYANVMRSSFPVEYQAYDALIQKHNPGDTIALDVSAMIVIVRIECVERFFIKDRLTDKILQGSAESQLKTHIINLRICNLTGQLGEEKIDKRCNWVINDIDLMNTMKLLTEKN